MTPLRSRTIPSNPRYVLQQYKLKPRPMRTIDGRRNPISISKLRCNRNNAKRANLRNFPNW
ncbi:hypothetical protein COCCADRAFT_99532 [Bipolaris zeicola 26-R-13]|uniref:Uncharacterized protein n=1 Tax=Cochliobolus carbonum (strain 26-R-13) TaxID=930089 RepID=W6Y2E5_COCC2|nr:uncharacterized protein COCCADRAFT_99532 [Bipolaris zeicola 26-R-13]EUC32113.1 hypothetical protein COCCADRAFT_99532 [Bipolaris zeicola 26-R-13]